LLNAAKKRSKDYNLELTKEKLKIIPIL
jgi:hypothetical protein